MHIKNFIYHDKLNYKNDEFLNRILGNFYNNGPSRKPNWDCYVETSLQNQDKPTIPSELTIEINKVIKDFAKKLNNTFFETLRVHSEEEIWYNIYTENMYQEIHAHSCFLFSGIFFLKFNKLTHSAPIFYNNFFKNDYFNSSFSDIEIFSYQPEVSEGDIIIFPSNMFHEVKSQTSNEPRITVSFNTSVKNVDIRVSNNLENFNYE